MSFLGINIALSGLFAQQRALDVTGQNVANVNTPGYHRQEVQLAARTATAPGLGSALLSGGVEVTGVRRADTNYVDLQIRMAASGYGRWSAAQEPLGSVQTILTMPAEESLSGLLDGFYTAWQGLASSPEQLGPRLEVRQAASQLASSLNTRYEQLRELQTSIYATVETTVEQINALAVQVAALNVRIAAAEAAGQGTGELVDQRQQALEQLAEMGGVVAFAAEAKGAIISLGGRPLVQGGQAFAIEVSRGPLGEVALTWAGSGDPVTAAGGALEGLITVRDQQIPHYLAALDDLAAALITQVNQLHQTGAGMAGQVGDFFTGTGAADLALAAPIAADAAAIAAGQAGLPADGSVALAIAGLRDQTLIAGQTTNAAAAALAADIGSRVQEAQNQAATNQAVRRQMVLQQQSIGGVSLDEEMAKMIEYQHAYNAAARVLSTVDEMIGDLLSAVG